MMIENTAIPTSRTKVIVPRQRPELLSRPRLLDRMMDFLDKKVALITAPAGYGKTSLLIDLCHNSEFPFCWLSLDMLDREPQRFIEYFIQSLNERFPGLGAQARSTLENLTNVDQGIEQLVVSLVNEVYDKIPQHFMMILDDYHLVGDVPVIQNFLSRFIQLVDENCHLVIASRALIGLPDLPLMVARDQVVGLDFSELAFHTEEIQALFAQNHNIHISEEKAQELVRETEGWITGLQFSGLAITQGMGDRLRDARAAGVDLFDYLGQQVLDQQPQSIRLFLLRSSLLEEFDASLCESALESLYPEPQDWQNWLQVILQNNLFALPLGFGNGWVRYHHLFRDFLQARFAQERPEEVTPILQNLVQAYGARNEWEKAYHIQKRLGDVDALAELVERAAPHLMSRALGILDSWLNELPPSILNERPGLLSIRGTIAYMKGNLLEGLNLLNQAEKDFRDSGNITGLTLALVRRSTVHRFLGNYDFSLQDAEEVIRLTENNDDMQLLFADALRQKGLSLFHEGRSRYSVKPLERALDVYIRLEDQSHIPILLMETGMAYRALGKEDETLMLYDKALNIWKKEGNLTWQATLLNNQGVLHHLRGEYEPAVMCLEEGLLCARRSNYRRMEALLLTSLGDVYMEVEDYPLANQSYRQAQSVAEEIGEQFVLTYLSLVQIDLLVRQQRQDEALRLLDLDVENGKSVLESSKYERGLYDQVRGKLSLLQNRFDQAVQEFWSAVSHFEKDGHQAECAMSKVWLSAAYLQTKKHQEALQEIREAISNEGRTGHSIIVTAHQARHWLKELDNGHSTTRSVREFMGKAEQFEKDLPKMRRQLRRLSRTVNVPDARLTIRGFGRMQVEIGGRLLTMSDWQTQSVRDLFFYFLTLTEPATKEQIGLALWSDVEEPSRLRLRFKNELYRLRRAVGTDTILFENDRYRFNRNLDYEYDVEAFESFLQQAEASQDTNQKIELYRKAAKLVRGFLLEDLDNAWVWPDRERISQSYLKAMIAWSDLLKLEGRFQEALAACQHAISYEPVFEDAYRNAMLIMAQSNDRSGIIRLYQIYEENMQRELDLPPSTEMLSLYKRLIL